MFERRIKIFLALLFTVTMVLVLRAAQLQIVRRAEWNEQAIDTLKRTELVDTVRGTLRDCRGNVIATDVACIDACVDYRALTDPPDEKWVNSLAIQWARQRRTLEWRAADPAARKRIVAEETQHVLDHINAMWPALAEMSGRPVEEIDDIRHDIVRRIEMSRRYNWYRKYRRATEDHGKRLENEPSPWWKSWLIDDAGDAPQLDDFDTKVSEQNQAHPILSAISADVQNKLGKNIDDYPGLVLRPGMTRLYPYGEVACHVVGSLSPVRPEDVKRDPNTTDELRKYQYSDLIGRSGLEALCEPLLRGARGRIEHYLGDDSAAVNVANLSAQPGRDVTTTIDMELQSDVLKMFQNADVQLRAADPVTGQPAVSRQISLHGGAVLIDLRNNEVRALVSNPTFDPNTLTANYKDLIGDDLNRALLNRATQYPLETGSTIKPVVGIGAITQGVLGVNEGIECTGYLVVNKVRYGFGRCWVASKYERTYGREWVAHHPIPHPHQGHDGNPDGFLTFSDALERSCNVFFETAAHRLGLAGLTYWMDKFGLGRPTGIGIAEMRGTLPDTYHGDNPTYATFVSGIGQSPVSATALQMANVAATIARNGVWMRPTLLGADDTKVLRKIMEDAAPATQPTNAETRDQPWWKIPDRVDLQLSPPAVAAARDGMYRVVNSPSGTGTNLADPDTHKAHPIIIAGKTGTAEAAPFKVPVKDEFGKVVLDERGKKKMVPVSPSTLEHPNPVAPWYIGFEQEGKLRHSWIIGYAPAKNPQVAFAVMVEYGGGGGHTAALIARGMLDAAMKQGYLQPENGRSDTQISQSTVRDDR